MEILGTTLYPILVMGGLAILFAIGLGVAAKAFYVHVDPRIKQVEELLPGANCGGCGYAGCADCAVAIVEGGAPVTACMACPEEIQQEIAKITGKIVEEREKEVAWIMCVGAKDKAERRFQYEGIEDCGAASVVARGHKGCLYGCLGLGTCVKKCPFDAMTMGEDGLPKVDIGKCTGCGTCVRVCPRSIPKVLPLSQKVAVLCSSHYPPPVVKKLCEAGCLGCGACKKACPEEAITLEDSLAVVDPDKCKVCGECMEKCPTGVIRQILPAEVEESEAVTVSV